MKVPKNSGGWKPVVLKPEVFCEGAESLISFEELTDYTLSTRNEKELTSKKTKKRRPKKRKAEESDKLHPSKLPRQKWLITNAQECESVNANIANVDKKLLLNWSNIFVPDCISEVLLEKGFVKPTAIQNLCIPAAIRGRRDIVGAAETGSGKTLAFGIPVLYGIMKNFEAIEKKGGSEGDKMKLWSLILVPTRELAVQVKNHLCDAAKNTSVTIAAVVGGLSMEKQQRLLSKKPHVVVATPGRLWELIKLGEPHFENIESVRFLVIDETDRMLEKNHFPELGALLERMNLNEELKKLRQNFVFSATLTLVHNPPQHILKKRWRKNISSLTLSPAQKLQSVINILGITNPKIVDITCKQGTAQNLKETRVLCSQEEKDFYLYYFIMVHGGKTIVFCNSIGCVKRLASILNLLKANPLPIHSKMIEKQRLKNLDRFREGRGVLLSTDVAGRGLDIPLTDSVIHYQVPRTSENYVHRSGRTARGENKGLSLLLVSPEEIAYYTKMLSTLQRKKDLNDFIVDRKVLEQVKERVICARDLEQLELKERRSKERQGWKRRALDSLELHSSDNEEKDSREEAIKKKTLKAFRMKLENMISQPLSISKTIDEVMETKPTIRLLKNQNQK